MGTPERGEVDIRRHTPAFQPEPPTSSRLERFAWIPIPFFCLAIATLALIRLQAAWNPPHLLAVLNILFLACVSLLVSILAGRGYLAGQSRAVLFLGAGTLALGLASALAGAPLAELTPNGRITIYNLGACLAGICHLVSAVRISSVDGHKSRPDIPLAVALYLTVITIIMITAIAVHENWLPIFFIDGQGPTSLDLFILWTTAGMFSLSAILLRISHGRNKVEFHRWYGLGLGLIAVGMVGVSLQTRFGSLLNWVSRSAQYMGGIYMLVAILTSVRRTGSWIIPLDQALQESEGRYKSLVELSPDAILVHTEGKYVFANPAAVKLFGAGSPEEIVGRDVMDFIPHDQRQFVTERIADIYGGAVTLSEEATVLGLNGQPVEVEVTGSRIEFRGKAAIQITLRDITARKRAERTLRDSEARFRLLSETAGRLLETDDPQHLANELCREVMEYLDCHAFFNFLVHEQSGRLHLNAYAGIPEEEARKIEWLDYGVAVCGCAARDGARIVAGDIFNCPDPRTELVKSYGIQAYACHPLMAQSRVLGTLSFGTRTRPHFSEQDLALMKTVADQVATAMERVQLIEALKESGEQLEMRVLERTRKLQEANEVIRDLYENAPCGYHSLGLDGNFLQINHTELQWLGYTQDEILGKKKWSDLLSPASQKIFEKNSLTLLKEGRISGMECELIRKDGTLLPVILNATTHTDAEGRCLWSRATIFDITERKHAERILRRYELLSRHARENILFISQDGRILEANDAACSAYGHDRESLLTLTIYDLRAPWTTDQIPHQMGKAFEDGILFETEHMKKDGTAFPVEVSSRGVTIGSEKILLTIIRDITESKNMEKHLTRADRLSSLGQLSGGIAHEIRNPLAGINLFVDVLCDEEKFTRTAQEQEILEEIKANIKRIDGIIKRVLDFSRLSDTTAQSRLNMSLLLADSLKLWQSRMTKQSIQLNLSVEERLADVLGDPIEIQQVLTNLIQNAIEAMENGGSLNISIRNGILTMDKKRPAVITTVQDSGSGIPLEVQKHIFNPFFTTKHTGTGLGLAISHRIVSSHGGLIHFESAPGAGTLFTVELPAATEA